MIFTDGIHLISDFSIDELHYFAQAIELKSHWFHSHPRHPHYDFTTSKDLTQSSRFLLRALEWGAKMISSRDLVQIGIDVYKKEDV